MKLLYIIAAFILISFTSPGAFSQNDKVIQEGEEIEYEVSYLGIKLGVIKVETQQMEMLGDKLLYKAKSIMESYKGIPFFSLTTRFESWIDPTLSYSHKFVGNTKFSDDPWVYQKLDFNYDDDVVVFNMWRDRNHEMKKSFDTPKKWNDGLSIFFLARQYANIGKNIKIPTFMNEDTAYTTINFEGKRENISIDAIDYPVRTIYFSGKAHWEGIYGLSGKFEGWFSDDIARVPIKAHMKVILGNITITLVKWKRKNWTPPRADI